MGTELELVKEAKQGNVQAFAKLYERVYVDLYRFALYTLGNTADAQDMVSDAVTDAFATIGMLRVEEAFRSWIFKILSNKCKQKLKEYMNRAEELTPEMMEQMGVADDSEHAAIRSLFFGLQAEERMIIALHMFSGYTSRELAEYLHMNENTIRSKESRAIKKIVDQYWD